MNPTKKPFADSATGFALAIWTALVNLASPIMRMSQWVARAKWDPKCKAGVIAPARCPLGGNPHVLVFNYSIATFETGSQPKPISTKHLIATAVAKAA